MRPIHITYVTTGLQTGGAERMLFNLLSGLDRQLFLPTVVSLRDPESGRVPFDQLGVAVHSVEMEPSRPTIGALRRLRQIVATTQPDIVQGWMYHGNIAAVAATLRGNHVPVCWSIHHSIYDLKREKPLTAALIRIGALLARVPARIMYVSHVSQQQHKQLGYATKNAIVVPNGVDPALFRPSPEARITVRKELHLPADALLIGLIARFHPQKDHRSFLQAAAQIARTYPNAYFVLAGSGTSEQNQELTKLVAAAGIVDRVRMLGERSDVPRITAALDIACSTSIFGEALSLALQEAMACGVPCVVTNVGDSAHLVGAAGMIVPPGDAAAFAYALHQLLEAGPSARAALGYVARQRINEHYSLQRIVQDYQSVYRCLIESSYQQSILQMS